MKYRNKSERDLSIVGYGIVPAGHVADLPFEINNANFEKVEGATMKVDDIESKPQPVKK